MSPIAPGDIKREEKPKAGALRVAEALAPAKNRRNGRGGNEFSARLTVSEREVLKTKDFAQMSVEEIAKAKRADRRTAIAGRRAVDAAFLRR